MGIQVRWWWDSGTITTKLDVIWGMSTQVCQGLQTGPELKIRQWKTFHPGEPIDPHDPRPQARASRQHEQAPIPSGSSSISVNSPNENSFNEPVIRCPSALAMLIGSLEADNWSE